MKNLLLLTALFISISSFGQVTEDQIKKMGGASFYNIYDECAGSFVAQEKAPKDGMWLQFKDDAISDKYLDKLPIEAAHAWHDHFMILKYRVTLAKSTDAAAAETALVGTYGEPVSRKDVDGGLQLTWEVGKYHVIYSTGGDGNDTILIQATKGF